MKAIVVNHLTHAWNRTLAVDDLTLEVEQGELFGLIGPDGAGKTTLMRLLATLITPAKGTIRINGLDAITDYRTIRASIGYMPQFFSLYPDLTVEENLHFFAALFGTEVTTARQLIDPVFRQLAPFLTRKAGKLSGGMKQKLALSCALIHHPNLLLLDEPTTGVDAVSRQEFWDLLEGLNKQGITIVVSTPYMDEAARCQRVALCNEGRLLSIDTPRHLTENFDTPLYGIKAKQMYTLLNKVRAIEGVADCYPCGDLHHLTLHSHTALKDIEELISTMEEGNIKRLTPTIEDVFIHLMKQ